MSNVLNGEELYLDPTKSYDFNIMCGFARYLCFGLPPGGFEGACITGDYELAAGRAHNSVRPRPGIAGSGWAGTADQDIVANLIEFVNQVFPEEARGGPLKQMQWCRNGGLSKNKDARLLFKLSNDVRWIRKCLGTAGITFDWETGEFH